MEIKNASFKAVVLSLILALFLLAFSACGKVEVDRITLDKTELLLTAGSEATLTATVTPEDATDKTVVWTTSKETVATVLDGVVTAVSAGRTTITASAGGQIAVCAVTVTGNAIATEGVALDRSELSLTVGGEGTLTATVTPDDATDRTVAWTTSDESVATVEDGTVTAVSEGDATITAWAGGKSAACKVSVFTGISSTDEISALITSGARKFMLIADVGSETARHAAPTIRLNADIDIILNLGGHSVYLDNSVFLYIEEGTARIDNGLIDNTEDVFDLVPVVQEKRAELILGKDLTVISQKYNAVYLLPKNHTDMRVYNAILVTEATLIAKGNYAAIQGNGSAEAGLVRYGTSVTVNGGHIEAPSTAIYQPQYGELIINGGTIIGDTGVEVRAGELIINGGTIIGRGDPFTADPNGNGSTTVGAAVACVQHATKLPLIANIAGGTLQGMRAFFHADIENNGEEAAALVEITLGAGAVYQGEVIVDGKPVSGKAALI